MTKISMESEGQQIAVTVPLFLRKLWKMVNDEEAENIIGWNSTGDGFIIYDQLQFIMKLLPKYFKHNNMASFIRQLNFYDFHKVASIDKDEIQFIHSCFLKDLPETLVFIRRKCTSLRSKMAKDEEISEILNGVKELKTKHAMVDSELKMLKQENAALWSEVNNLRLKHAKQTRIINKIIHFLISYIHSHQNLPKRKTAVGRKNSQNLKKGPTILEIGYHNSPNEVQEKSKTIPVFTEPTYSGAITYPSSEFEDSSNSQPAERFLDEILDKVNTTSNEKESSKRLVRVKSHNSNADTSSIGKSGMAVNSKPSVSNTSSSVKEVCDKTSAGTSLNINLYNSASRKRQTALQSPVKLQLLENPKQHLGSYLDNTQVELESLQDMLNNLNSVELSNFYDIMGDVNETDLREDSTEAGLTSINQKNDGGDSKEGGLEGGENKTIDNTLVEELATLPLELNTNNPFRNKFGNEEYTTTSPTEPSTSAGVQIQSNLENIQYTTANMDNFEPEILTDEYFTI